VVPGIAFASISTISDNSNVNIGKQISFTFNTTGVTSTNYNVKLYGSTINTNGFYGTDPISNSHVQSYAFCVDIDTLTYLIDKEIFSLTNMINRYEDVVVNKEIKMSRDIINNNWNIGCIFHHYNNIDFTNLTKYSDFQFLGDLTVTGYYAQLMSPYELIFIKEKYISNKDWIHSYIRDLD
jgi:hypothetical protein